MAKTGVLIVNLGTPDDPSPASVRKYLREFLGDPRVLDIPAPGRWALLNLFILPFRPRKSAAAYQKIWGETGSPLLANTRAFAEKLQSALPENYQVEFAMRYGNPSIASKLDALLAHPLKELIVFPQYPHYSSASTGSSLQETFRVLAGQWNIPSVRIVPPFYADPGFIAAFAARGLPLLNSLDPDHVLFSYHGLPERHIKKSESYGDHCLKRDDSCCAAMSWENRFCYRAQCFETTRRLARSLGLGPDRHSIGFQSRLGRTPWIKPYTDVVIRDLAKQGKRRLLVFSPAFTADCLETLEEIALRARADFLAAGGEELLLVPSLNANDDWVEAARDIILKT